MWKGTDSARLEWLNYLSIFLIPFPRNRLWLTVNTFVLSFFFAHDFFCYTHSCSKGWCKTGALRLMLIRAQRVLCELIMKSRPLTVTSGRHWKFFFVLVTEIERRKEVNKKLCKRKLMVDGKEVVMEWNRKFWAEKDDQTIGRANLETE